jgi:hypothetical protein
MFYRFLLELTDPLSFIQIREDVKSGVYVENLTEEQVSTMKDVTQLLLKVRFIIYHMSSQALC